MYNQKKRGDLIMYVCRTLDYIVNTDLHLYLFTKLEDIRIKGIPVEIELTEPITRIPMDSVKYLEIVNMVIDNAIDLLDGAGHKKLKLYMFYTGEELHLVIQCWTDKGCLCESSVHQLNGYNNVEFLTTKENGKISLHLVVMP